MASTLNCPNCNMQFRSPGLLFKHQSRFCVGAPTKDPRMYAKPQDNWDLDSRSDSDSQTQQGKVMPLGRSSGRYEWGAEAGSATPEAQLWEARSQQLRRQQRKQGPRNGDDSSRVVLSSPAMSTNSSMTIDLPPSSDDEETPRLNVERENRNRQLRAQAENHSKNMADYKSKTRALANQKEEIERRLRMLNDPSQPSNEMSNSLIQELRDQEIRNQEALADLRKQIQEINTLRPIVMDQSLLAEISLMRQTYLRQGGNNPAILAQMAELEMEAMTLDKNADKPRGQRDRQDRGKLDSLSAQLAAFELENDKLQRELADVQERNNRRMGNRGKDDEQDAEALDLQLRQHDYQQKLLELEQEIEMLKNQARLERLRRDVEHEKRAPPEAIVTYRQPVEPVPAFLTPRGPALMELDTLYPGPYDPNAGFMVFYDFVTGLDPSVHAMRLVVGLYNNAAQYGEPSILPPVYCDSPTIQSPRYYPPEYKAGMVTAKQPVPGCPPARDLGLVVELQTAPPGGRLHTHAWCKVDLFDAAQQLLAGRWRVPFRTLPIRPNASTNEIMGIPQHGVAELYLRLVNHRDAHLQSAVTVNPQETHRYLHPPQAGSVHYPQPYVPPPPSTTPPPSPDLPRHVSHDRQHYDYDPENTTVGFQIDRVKNAEPGEGKVRITAYCKSSGKVVHSDTSPVTCSTTAVRSYFKHMYHVFGRQEAAFHHAQLAPDVVIVARFYLRRRLERGFDNELTGPHQDLTLFDDETLVAWATMPLMVGGEGNGTGHSVNVGTHTLQLYEAPAPDPEAIPLEIHNVPKEWRRYGNATLRLHVFVDKPRPGSLTPSLASDGEEEEDTCPEYAWLPCTRTQPPMEPFHSSDGFDLYIDACRHLPDVVTITRVAGRILNQRYDKVGKDINTNVRLDSDMYNPVYDHRVEVRQPNMAPTATILLKVYTVEKFTKQLMVAGYATLNVFVETGTERQPVSDSGGMQVSLNEGAHQLRLYELGPNGADPLSESCLREAGVRIVPGASLLVRLAKAPIGPQGRPLEAEKVPQADWERLGLYKPRPSYTDRVYLSTQCKPTKSECRLLRGLVARNRVTIREALHIILDVTEVRKLRTDKSMEQFIRSKLTKMMDTTPLKIDLAFIAPYEPKLGIKFALDAAVNLPWSNFTHANFCLNPPGAFYMGQPYAAYDKLHFTDRLDFTSTNRAPSWKDGYHDFPSRSHHSYLTMVIHLQDINVTVSADSYKYGLLDQAWTACPVFREGYAHTSVFQLPLIRGAPSVHALKQLARDDVKHWVQKGVASGNLKLIEGASVFVRMADARRGDELSARTSNNLTQIDRSVLPEQTLSEYDRVEHGKQFLHMVPQGKTPEDFLRSLSTKYKSLVYKLYEEGKMGER